MLGLETHSFKGISVGAFATRAKEELSHLIEKRDGIPVIASALREVPLEDNKEALQFASNLLSGNVDVLILLTSTGAQTLFKVLELKHSTRDIREALRKLIIISRDPKTTDILDQHDLKPTYVVPEPHTWRDILKTIDKKADIKGKKVAVQEYREPNRVFLSELKERGADVFQIPVYRTELPYDTKPILDLIRNIIAGKVDVLVFTNSTQVAHVMAVARREGVAQEFRRSLAKRFVASIGPACNAAMMRLGFPIDHVATHPKMETLVDETATKFRDVISHKSLLSIEVLEQPSGLARPGDALHDSLFLKACRREKIPQTPIWLMRQAGRYMREYRELRARMSFLELCKTSDLASEVTVDAAHRLNVDAAIIFSDILLILEPLGFDLSYGKDQGPVIGNPFSKESDLLKMKPVDVEGTMSFQMDAIRKTRNALKKDLPLIGFCGAPFTLASYLIEGKSSRNFLKTKGLMISSPKVWHTLMDRLTTALIDLLNIQIAAGVQAVQIFDSWVGCLTPEDFRNYVLPYTRRLIQGVTPGVPVISFGTQTTGLLPLLKQAGGDVIGVDWRIELDEAWDVLGDVAIQGNLDPTLLLAKPEVIRAHAKRILTQAGGRPGHIFNLGHGVLPETPIEHVLDLVDYVKNFKPND